MPQANSQGSHSGKPHVRLLGIPSVLVGGKYVASFRSNRIPALLGLLASKVGPWRREAVAAALWPDSPGPVARHNLRQTALYVRQLLGEGSLEADRQSIALSRSIRTDLDDVMRTSDPWLTGDEATSHAEALISAYGGSFLEGCDDEWAQVLRTRFEDAYVRALLTVSLSELIPNPARALELAERAATIDPFLDSARALKIRALRAVGESTSALREFSEYGEFVRDELAIDPSPLVTEALTIPLEAPESAQVEDLESIDPDVSSLLSGTRPRQGLILAVANVPLWISRSQLRVGVATVRAALAANEQRAGSASYEAGVVALAELLAADGRNAEAKTTLDAILGQLPTGATLVRALILRARMSLRAYQGREAEAYADMALAASAGEATELRIDALNCTASAMMLEGRLFESEKRAKEGLELARKLGDWLAEANGWGIVAVSQLRTGRPGLAVESANRALKGLEGRESPQASASRLRMSRLLEESGDHDRARNGYVRGIEEARRFGDQYGLAIALTYLGDLESVEGRHLQGLALHQEALELRRSLSENLGAATSLRGIGIAYLGIGEVERAREALRESSQLFLACDSQTGHASVLLPLAKAALLAGDDRLGSRLARRARHLLMGMSPQERQFIGPAGDRQLIEANAMVMEFDGNPG